MSKDLWDSHSQIRSPNGSTRIQDRSSLFTVVHKWIQVGQQQQHENCIRSEKTFHDVPQVHVWPEGGASSLM